MKKISFQAISPKTNFNDNRPSPAVKSIPDWFRKLVRFPEGKNQTTNAGQVKQTIKGCSPFLDSLSMGYLIKLEFDVLVKKTETGHYFEWREGDELITMHSPEQLANEQVPAEFSKQPYKFDNKYLIKTPPGYSTLFVHPLNRTDLPFHTLSGVVETDNYGVAVLFPFLIKNDFEGVLEAGTPIVQCIPVKRETWEHEHVLANDQNYEKSLVQLKHKLISSYKSQWWVRKDYR